MNIIDTFIIADIFTKISIIVLLLLIILVFLILKLTIKHIAKVQSFFSQQIKKNKQSRQPDQAQIIFNKQSQVKNKLMRILRNYSIFGCCLSEEKIFSKFLNSLLMLACFCSYYFLIVSNFFGISELSWLDYEGDLSDETVILGVKYLLIKSVSCWWLGGVLIIIDFYVRNYLRDKQEELKAEVSKLESQESKARICFIYNIWFIYSGFLSIIGLAQICFILYHSLSIPPVFILQNLSFIFLVSHLSSRTLLQLPIMALLHQIFILIFTAIYYLIIKFRNHKTKIKNTHKSQTKITTTMDVLGDESNENIQARIQEKFFASNTKKQKPLQLNDEIKSFKSKKIKNILKRSPPTYLDNAQYSHHSPQQDDSNLQKQLSIKKARVSGQQQAISPFVCRSLHSRHTVKNRSAKSSIYELPDKIYQNNTGQFQGIAEFNIFPNNAILEMQSDLGEAEKTEEVFHTKQDYNFEGYCFKDLGVIDRSKQPQIELHKRNKKRSLIVKQECQNIAPLRKRRFSNLEYIPHKKMRVSGPILYESPEKKNRQFCLQEIKEVYLKQ